MRVSRAVRLTIFILMISHATFVANAISATYYVDYSAGSDNNPGTSMTAPFKRCPGDQNATGLAGGITLLSGDTLIFKGGVEYIGAIKITSSGTSANRITYDGNASGTWGSGKARLQGNQIYSEGFEFTGANNYISIVNFEITGYTSLGIHLKSANNILIKDCYIHRISDWNFSRCYQSGGSPLCTLDYVHSLGIGLYIESSFSDVVIDGVEITRVGHSGIKVSNCEGNNLEIKNSTLHDYIHWQLDIAPAAGKTISNVYIHGNKFYNLYHYSNQYWSGEITDEKVNYGTGENPHQDGIFIRNPLIGTTSNIRIYDNDFFNEKEFTASGGTAMLFISEPRSLNDTFHIYNNTFQGCYAYDSILLGFLFSGRINVYNNTWYMKDKGAIRIFAEAGSTTQVSIKNNIFDMDGGGFALKLTDSYTASRVTSDYNVYRQAGTYIIWDGSYYASLGAWQNAPYRQDQNSVSVSNLYFTLPRSISIASTSNLKLLLSSPARGRGVDLGAGYRIDKNGITRPTGAAWDAGAYQYGGTPSNLGAPQNFRRQ